MGFEFIELPEETFDIDEKMLAVLGRELLFAALPGAIGAAVVEAVKKQRSNGSDDGVCWLTGRILDD